MSESFLLSVYGLYGAYRTILSCQGLHFPRLYDVRLGERGICNTSSKSWSASLLMNAALLRVLHLESVLGSVFKRQLHFSFQTVHAFRCWDGVVIIFSKLKVCCPHPSRHKVQNRHLVLWAIEHNHIFMEKSYFAFDFLSKNIIIIKLWIY